MNNLIISKNIDTNVIIIILILFSIIILFFDKINYINFSNKINNNESFNAELDTNTDGPDDGLYTNINPTNPCSFCHPNETTEQMHARLGVPKKTTPVISKTVIVTPTIIPIS